MQVLVAVAALRAGGKKQTLQASNEREKSVGPSDCEVNGSGKGSGKSATLDTGSLMINSVRCNFTN